jgi:hypothetical protein
MISNKRKGIGLRPLTTAEFADSELVKPQTVRKQHSKTGSYFGVVPVKKKNGRLAWPIENDDHSENGGA